MKTIDEYITAITLDKANLQYISDNLVINGSLLVSLRKAMQDYAKECCKEQREICAEHAEIHYPASNNLNPTVDRGSIKNAPEPTMI